MSDTPRTDEAEFYVDHFDGNFTEILVTRSNLPRQLERELAAKAEECERIKKLLRECAEFMAGHSESCCIDSAHLRQACEFELDPAAIDAAREAK